jgi:hypothetical protein
MVNVSRGRIIEETLQLIELGEARLRLRLRLRVPWGVRFGRVATIVPMLLHGLLLELSALLVDIIRPCR